MGEGREVMSCLPYMLVPDQGHDLWWTWWGPRWSQCRHTHLFPHNVVIVESGVALGRPALANDDLHLPHHIGLVWAVTGCRPYARIVPFMAANTPSHFVPFQLQDPCALPGDDVW